MVDAELIERAAERAADKVVSKLIVELRETNPAAPPAEDLVVLAEHPEVYRDYMELWKQDLDRRWEYTQSAQGHDQAMEVQRHQAQAALDEVEMRALATTLQNAPKYALAFGLAGLVVALLVALYGSAVAGAVIAGLDITTGIGLFLYSKNQSAGPTPPDTQDDE